MSIEVIEPEIVPAIIDNRTKNKLTRNELSGRNLKILTDYVENGLNYEELASKYELAHGSIFHVISKYSELYKPGITHNKLKRLAFLNRKHAQNEKLNNPLDPVKIVQELREEYEPRKNSLEIVQNKMEINLNELDSVSSEDKMERIRRALSGG